MHNYSATDLNNYHIQQEAFDIDILSKASNEKIKSAHPCNLYTPNFFIRIALSLLCIVCVSFAAVLIFFITYSSSDDIIPGILFFMFLICYGLLEYIVKQKKYYNAGIDNMLQVFTIIFFAGIFVNGNYPEKDVLINTAVLISAIWLCIRFTDSFMALISYAAFIVLICILCEHTGEIFILYSPFITMLASALFYVIQRWLKKKKQFIVYKKCFGIIRIAALSGFYISCNVYAVTQLSNSIFPENIIAGKTYFLLLLTLDVIIPAAYLLYGFIKNKIIFLRIGFVTLVATVVTISYFYPIVSGEIWLIVGGSIMIITGYAGMHIFKISKYNFTSNSYTSLGKQLITAEALTTVQSAYKSAPLKGVQFGGGSSGGAGASGNW